MSQSAKNPDEIPPGTNCEWCPAPAKIRLEIQKKVKGGWVGACMYSYCCHEHERVARDTTHDFSNDHSASN